MLINSWKTTDVPDAPLLEKAKKLTVRISRNNFNGTGAVLAHEQVLHQVERVFIVTARHNIEMASLQSDEGLSGEERKTFWKKPSMNIVKGIKIHYQDGQSYDAEDVKLPDLTTDVAVLAVKGWAFWSKVSTETPTLATSYVKALGDKKVLSKLAQYYVRLGYGFSRATLGRNDTVTKSEDKKLTFGSIPRDRLKDPNDDKKLKAAITDQGSGDGKIITFDIPDEKDTSLNGDSGGPVFGFFQENTSLSLLQVGCNTGANLFASKTDDRDWPSFENNGFTLLDAAFYKWCGTKLFR